MGTGATVDFSGITTAPATTDLPPVKIEGTIVLTGTGTLVGPQVPSGTGANPFDAIKFASLGEAGKILLKHGTSFVMGGTHKIVGKSDTESAYTWAADNDNAEIEINGTGITIRDSDGGGDPAVITIKSYGAVTLKEQTLTLGTNVELRNSGDKGLLLAGDTATTPGAKLMGPGKLVIHNGVPDSSGIVPVTEIVGGAYGWQMFGTEVISIAYADSKTQIKVLGTTTNSLRALGPGATITQLAVSSNELNIGANIKVELGGTTTSAAGIINLAYKTEGGIKGKLSFTDATSIVLAGAGTGVALTVPGGSPVYKIGDKVVTLTTLTGTGIFVAAGGYLNQLVGVAGGTIEVSDSAVQIGSTAIATVTATP